MGNGATSLWGPESPIVHEQNAEQSVVFEKSVLVISEEPTYAKYVTLEFDSLGARSVRAEGWPVALELLAKSRIDMVIVDFCESVPCSDEFIAAKQLMIQNCEVSAQAARARSVSLTPAKLMSILTPSNSSKQNAPYCPGWSSDGESVVEPEVIEPDSDGSGTDNSHDGEVISSRKRLAVLRAQLLNDSMSPPPSSSS